MSGRFMRVKRVCISTLTLLVIASQLCGCASSTQKEMLNMYNNNQSITIELAEPISQEQGEQREYEWVELASLDNYSDFRMAVDDIMGITAHGENGKNGVVYVDLEGKHTNNSTLRFAFSNQKFLDSVWNNSDSMEKIIEATNSNYADIETDAMARAAFINAYFNIFADAEPNYFNGNQTLTRAEFLGGVYRAVTPVYEITLGNEFGAAVDPAGTSDDTVYAEKMEDYSYLTTEYRNLNEDTFGGTITRAEAIYTLVKMLYSDEYDATTGNEKVNYADAKNGGNIAKECGFITVDKKSGEVTYKDLWKTYELSYALQTADKGLPTDLYRALVVAEKHGLIKGTDSRWDEAVVKREVIDMLVAAFEDLGTVNNADRGATSGEAITNETNENTNTDVEVDTSTSVAAYDSLDLSKHMTKNSDGTYSFTEEFMGTISSYDCFEGASEDEIVNFLNTLGLLESGIGAEDLHNLILCIDVNVHDENIPIKPNDQKPSQNNNQTQDKPSNNNSNSGNNNSGNNNNAGNSNNRAPENDGGYVNNGDGTITSSDGTFTMGDGSSFGGGGQGEIPEGFTGLH